MRPRAISRDAVVGGGFFADGRRPIGIAIPVPGPVAARRHSRTFRLTGIVSRRHRDEIF